MLEHLVHDCHHCHHWNGLCSFQWMLIVWRLDKRTDQEWVGCIFDVGVDIQCVLFDWCKGEGVTSQVIHIIQKTNTMFIDMSQVVHIIQKSNIMSCFHSLHVDILESIYLSLWHDVSFTCVWHHISRYIFNFIYQNNLNLNNLIEAWCCSLPSIPLVVFWCVELPWPILFSSFWNGRCFSCQLIVWTYFTWKPLCILFSWNILLKCWIICISWCCF